MNEAAFCDNVFTIPQFTGTCWFNASLMVLFYSKLFRNFFLKHLEDIPRSEKQKKAEFYKIISQILKRSYIKNKNVVEFQDTLKPESILTKLHNLHNKTFFFDPAIDSGFHAILYMPRIFRYMNLSHKMLYFDTEDSRHGLSSSNTGNFEKVFVESWKYFPTFRLRTHTVRLVQPIKKMKSLVEYESINDHLLDKRTKVGNMKMKTTRKDISIPDDIDILFINNTISSEQPTSTLTEKLYFKNCTFVVDSVLLNNFNIFNKAGNHEICGVTCKNKRYLYSGWTRNTIDAAIGKGKGKHTDATNNACKLYNFDWFADKNKKNFCIKRKDCTFPDSTAEDEMNKVCFNTSRQTFIYVRDIYCNPHFDKYDSVVNSVSSNVPEKDTTAIKETGTSPKTSMLNCTKNYSLKELKVLVDEFKKPKSLKAKTKKVICDAIHTNVPNKANIKTHQKNHAKREKLAKEKSEKDKLEKEKSEKEKLEKDKLEKEKSEKEKLANQEKNKEETKEDSNTSLLNCTTKYSVKELKVMVDKLKQPKSLKAKTKKVICDAIHTSLPHRDNKQTVRPGPKAK